jgi:AcrR family transcriptional regulator
MDVRERLLTAALRVFEEAGSRGATTRRIAAEAGVNEITLFRHFGSKAALLAEALGRLADAPLPCSLPAVPVDPAAELLEWSRFGYAMLRRNAAMLRTAMGELEESPLAARCAAQSPARAHDELHAYLVRLRAAGMASGEWDPDAASAMLMGAIFADAMSRDMMPEKFPFSVDEAPERYVTLFLRAIGCAPLSGGTVAGVVES